MKKIIFILSFLCCLWGISAPGPSHLGSNTNCNTIYQVCEAVNTTSINNTSSPDCVGGEMELWFAVDVMGSSFHVNFESMTDVSAVYIYGPFLDMPNCSNMGTAVSTFNPYTGSSFSLAPDKFSSTPSPGKYIVRIAFSSCTTSIRLNELSNVACPEVSCDEEQECVVFQPDNLKRYWVSAWVKEDHSSQVLDYTSYVDVIFTGANTSVAFVPSGEIIDGWQRIVGDFIIPFGTTNLTIDLVNDSDVDVYFDDIRVHPWNAGMKSYVYDPETFWLTAELDDNNYATFYEYDKEGGLVRIKKETERGVMTIQETRSHTKTQ